MTTVEEVNTVVESVRQVLDGESVRPLPEHVRGKCPKCGDALVSNAYYTKQYGSCIIWECWSSIMAAPVCDYRKRL